MFVDWFVIGSIGILFGAQLILFTWRYFRREMKSRWLVAFLATGLAWILIGLARFGVPKEIRLGNWRLVGSSDLTAFADSPLFLLDNISWTFSIAILSLAACVILTAVIRLADGSWKSWFGALTLATLGLAAALAGNLLTFVFAWVAIDIVELIIWLIQARENTSRSQVFSIFTARFSGTLILMMVTLIPASLESSLTSANIPLELSPIILLAAGLRLGLIPIYPTIQLDRQLRPGISAMLQIIPLASGLVILVRVAEAGVPSGWLLPLLFYILFIFVLSSYRWAVSGDRLAARPHWAIVVGCVSFIAAVLGQPLACLFWGVTSILTGGVLYLGSIRTRNMLIFPLAASLSLTMLPFTPTWQVTSIFAGLLENVPSIEAIIIFPLGLLGYSIFALGYFKHGMQIDESQPKPERWMWFLYLPGLALLLLLNFALGWINLPDYQNIGLLAWMVGILVCGIVVGLWVVHRQDTVRGQKGYLMIERSLGILVRLFSWHWIYSLVVWFYKFFRGPVNILNSILEGEGGLLWSYLFLIMLLSLAFQVGLVR
jgi:hypothetical protein